MAEKIDEKLKTLEGKGMRLENVFEIVLSATREDGNYWSWQQRIVAANKLEKFLECTGYTCALPKFRDKMKPTNQGGK